MTFKSLMNFGSFGKTQYTPVERYHSGGGSYHSDSHGGYKGQKGGKSNGAALSALTLLAFLFLINVMQQSLQDNNSTSTTTTTTLFVRNDEQQISLDGREDKETKKSDESSLAKHSYGTPSKSVRQSYVKV